MRQPIAPVGNWRRISGTGSYQWIRARRNAQNGAFDGPPTGNLDDEWGPGPADLPDWMSMNVVSSQLRNLERERQPWQANDGVSVYGDYWSRR